MPYNPGVTAHGGEYIAQGIERGKSNLIQLFGWLHGEAEETSRLRKQLGTIEPGKADAFKAMSKSELQGYAQGMGAKMQMDLHNAQLGSAQSATQASQAATTHSQQLTEALKEAAAGNAAFGQAMQQAQPPVQMQRTNFLNPSLGLPSQGANTVGAIEVPTQGRPEAGALIAAMMRNPQAASSPVGQRVLAEWMQNESRMDRGTPEMMSLGEGKIPTIFNRYTGQFQVDPAYTAKQQSAERMSYWQTTHPTADEGGPPEAGDYYFDGQRWHQKGSRGLALFSGRTAADAGAPAAAEEPKAMGGYIIGRAYKGKNGQALTYLGGDPMKPTSWK